MNDFDDTMKYGPEWRISQRTKMCGFLLEIQQIWYINKLNESITVAKFEYNIGNMKDCEKQSTKAKKGHSKKAYNYWRFWRKMDDDAQRQKRGTPRMLIITVVFEEKTMLRLQDKNQALQECL